MSAFLASNFITNLSFNLQPRLLPLSLPRLKRSVVRCLSNKSNGSELPARYIPKKYRDENQAQLSSSGGKTPKNANGMRSNSSNGVLGHKTPKNASGVRSSSSNGVLGHKTLDRMEQPRRSRIDHEQSNVASDDAHVHVVSRVNEDENHGKRGVESLETKSRKVCQEVVEYMDVPQEVVEELQTIERDTQGQGCRFNQENSYDDGLTDTEYMEPLEEEEVEETQLYNVAGNGREKRSDTSRIRKDVEKLAIELLAKRAFTGVELRKKLTAKNFPVHVVDALLSDFQNRGLINDSMYAEMFSQSRWKSSSWGPGRIKQLVSVMHQPKPAVKFTYQRRTRKSRDQEEQQDGDITKGNEALVKKGVGESDAEKAIKMVFEDGEDSDRGSSMKLSESSLQNLYVQASKHWQRSQNVPHETRKARLIRWLQYRGFDWGVVSNMLKRLQSNDSS